MPDVRKLERRPPQNLLIQDLRQRAKRRSWARSTRAGRTDRARSPARQSLAPASRLARRAMLECGRAKMLQRNPGFDRAGGGRQSGRRRSRHRAKSVTCRPAPRPSAHSSQRGGNRVAQSRQPPLRKGSAPRREDVKPPARAADTSATGMTVPCGSRHSIRVRRSLFTNSLRRVTKARLRRPKRHRTDPLSLTKRDDDGEVRYAARPQIRSGSKPDPATVRREPSRRARPERPPDPACQNTRDEFRARR